MATPNAASWETLGSLKGPKGDTGNTGSDGALAFPAPRTVTYASSLTITAASVTVDRVNITMTGNLTLDMSGSTDGAQVRVTAVASSSTRTVSVSSNVDISTGLTRGTYSVAAGKLFKGVFEYSSLNSKWTLLAATVTSA